MTIRNVAECVKFCPNPTQTEHDTFYIFALDANGESRCVGTDFNRWRGKGLEIVIDNNHDVGFPPNKSKPLATKKGA